MHQFYKILERSQNRVSRKAFFHFYRSDSPGVRPVGVWIGLSPRGPRSAGSNPTPRECSDNLQLRTTVRAAELYRLCWFRLGDRASALRSVMALLRGNWSGAPCRHPWVVFLPCMATGLLALHAWWRSADRGTGRKHKDSALDWLSHRLV